MTNSGILVSALVIATLGGGVYYYNQAADTAPLPTVEAQAIHTATPNYPSTNETIEIAKIRNEIEQLNAQMLALQQRQASEKKSVANEIPATNAAPDQNAIADLRAKEDQGRKVHVDGVAESFRKESVDPKWASATGAAIQTAFEQDSALTGVVHQVDCRASSCRVAIEDDGKGDLMKSLPLLANNLAQTLPRVTAERIEDGSGRNSMVLYMSRE